MGGARTGGGGAKQDPSDDVIIDVASWFAATAVFFTEFTVIV